MKSARNYFTEALRMLLPVGILAFGVITFAAIKSQKKPPEQREVLEVLPLVEVSRVDVHNAGLAVQVDGTVVPHREVTLSAEVSGRITRMADECHAGRYVKQGDLLVEIDPRKYQLEVERLRQEVNQSESILKELDVEIENTKSLLELAEEEKALRGRELQRSISLFQQNAASESSVDEARRMELSARNSATTLRNQARKLSSTRDRLTAARDLAEAELQQAKLDVEKSQVRAPLSGVIVSESIEKDNFVQAGTELLSIDDTSAAEVRCSLRMEELEWILRQSSASSSRETESGPMADYQLPQTPVEVSYRSGGREYRWNGILWRYEGIGLDERTRTIPCRVLVNHPRQVMTQDEKGTLLPGGPRALVRGMYVKLKILTQPNVQLLNVPERAIQPGNVVYRVRDEKIDIVKLRNVSQSADEVLVPASTDGLQADDLVVVTPLLTVSEGMPVRLQESDQTADQHSDRHMEEAAKGSSR